MTRPAWLVLLLLSTTTLAAEATLSDDGLGVVHVRAAGLSDAVEAVGYLHARDRGYQMELLRRAALDLHFRDGDRLLSEMEAEDRALLRAYADGVNRFEHTGRGWWPALVLGPWRDWTEADSVAVAIFYSRWMAQMTQWNVAPFAHGGSNAWFGRGVGEAGQTSWLMAADPHLGFSQIPGMFYAVHLDIEAERRRECVALGVPGLPLFTFATGNSVAWAVTAMSVVAPQVARGSLVRVGQVWHFSDPTGDLHTLEASQVVLRPEQGTASIQGLGELVLESVNDRGDHVSVALPSFVDAKASGKGLGHLLRLPLAESAEQVSRAAGEYGALSVYWLAADREGGLRLRQGLTLLSAGGEIPPEPELELDATGRDFLANANNRPWPIPSRATLDFTERFRRIEQLHDSTPAPTLEDFGRWQNDRVDTSFDRYVSLLNRGAELALQRPPIPSFEMVYSPQYGTFIDTLTGRAWWQRAATWHPDLSREEPDPVLVQLVDAFSARLLQEKPLALTEGKAWLDAWYAEGPASFTGHPLETHDQVLWSTFLATAALFEPTAREFHLGSPYPWPLLWLSDRKTKASGWTPRALNMRGPGQHSAVLRLLGELGDQGRVRVVVPPGQSENPFSAHYDDFLPLWREGRALEIRLGQ